MGQVRFPSLFEITVSHSGHSYVRSLFDAVVAPLHTCVGSAVESLAWTLSHQPVVDGQECQRTRRTLLDAGITPLFRTHGIIELEGRLLARRPTMNMKRRFRRLTLVGRSRVYWVCNEWSKCVSVGVARNGRPLRTYRSCFCPRVNVGRRQYCRISEVEYNQARLPNFGSPAQVWLVFKRAVSL